MYTAGFTVNVLGDPDNGVIAAGYLGSFLLAGAYLAVSCMTSAMTRNQVVAFILAVVACLFLVLAGFNPVTDLMVRWASPAVVDTVAAFSVVTHFDGFQRGVIDTRNLFFFLSHGVDGLRTIVDAMRAARDVLLLIMGICNIDALDPDSDDDGLNDGTEVDLTAVSNALEKAKAEVEQENEAEQKGPYYGDGETGYWGPALAEAEAYSGAVSVEQTGTLFAGDLVFLEMALMRWALQPLTRLTAAV